MTCCKEASDGKSNPSRDGDSCGGGIGRRGAWTKCLYRDDSVRISSGPHAVSGRRVRTAAGIARRIARGQSSERRIGQDCTGFGCVSEASREMDEPATRVPLPRRSVCDGKPLARRIRWLGVCGAANERGRTGVHLQRAPGALAADHFRRGSGRSSIRRMRISAPSDWN